MFLSLVLPGYQGMQSRVTRSIHIVLWTLWALLVLCLVPPDPASAQRRQGGETKQPIESDIRILPPGPATVPQDNACSVAYHEDLSRVRATNETILAKAHTSARAPNADYPGRWLLSAELFPGPKKKITAQKADRVCAEPVIRGGRQTCARWELKPTGPQPITELSIASKPTAGELASLRALNDLVVARTAIPEIGNNGRYNWLVARIAGDFKNYVTQAPHPALCSGAPQMLDFYQGELAPLAKRMTDVGEIGRTVRGHVAARLSELAKLAPEAEALPASASYADLIVGLTGQITGKDKAAALSAATIPLKRLELAKASLLENANAAVLAAATAAASKDAAAAVSPGTEKPVTEKPATPSLPALNDAVYAALRMVEAGVYADAYTEKHRTLDAALNGTSRAIRAAHTKSCTCAE